MSKSKKQIEKEAELSELVDYLIDTAASRSGLSVHQHQFGGATLSLGHRDIAHVYYWGVSEDSPVVDLQLPLDIRKAVLGDGLNPQSTITFTVETEADAEAIVEAVEEVVRETLKRRPEMQSDLSDTPYLPC
jgi:hypothetical protein